jgi:hypothetical protein
MIHGTNKLRCELIDLAKKDAEEKHTTTVEALKHLRDTTNSKQQYDRAVKALRQMGVRDE